MTPTPRTNLWQVCCRETIEAQPLSRNLAVDLLVIGGGFTGCAAALEAAGQGATVCLLEAETIGHGGSGRNVGLVNAGLWLPPDDIIARIGEPAATRLIALLGAAPDRVFDLVSQEGIDCEPVRKGTLHCAHSAAGLRDLQDRHAQGSRQGAPLALLDAGETARRTGSTRYHGALFDPRAGTIQPLAYCRGLARAAHKAGARIYERSPVSDISHGNGHWLVSANGMRVRATALLLATNAYHMRIATPFAPAFVPIGYSQFATAPMAERDRGRILPEGEGCWDTALVMSSFRVDQAGRLIVGGMGNSDGFGGGVHAAWARRKLRQLFPDLASLGFEHRWSGKIAMTGDHLPRIVEFGPSALACFGYSGRGIGPGTIFGTLSAKALIAGDATVLPVAPIPSHHERFAGPRAAFYETGATLAHAASTHAAFAKPAFGIK